MIRKATALFVLAIGLAGSLAAQEKDPPKGVPNLKRVFVIMMENHGYQQIFRNPNEPYLNQLSDRSFSGFPGYP